MRRSNIDDMWLMASWGPCSTILQLSGLLAQGTACAAAFTTGTHSVTATAHAASHPAGSDGTASQPAQAVSIAIEATYHQCTQQSEHGADFSWYLHDKITGCLNMLVFK